VRSDRLVELEHGLVIKTAGAFHPIEVVPRFEVPRPEAPRPEAPSDPHNELLQQWKSQQYPSTDPTGILLHPFLKRQADPDTIKHEETTKDGFDTKGDCPHKDDANKCDDE
jgi:hypothetical protein